VTSFAIAQASRHRSELHRRSFKDYALWTVQILLALTFLVAGISKLVMSGDDMTKDSDLPVLFLRFIGVCELFGAIGLVAPSAMNIRRWLTPLAAAGLVIIMIGATSITVAAMGVLPALFPFVVGAFAAVVVFERRSWFHAA
jgi:uncharacterized membrane protein YphA (DoxX/SURF4 family)